MVSGPQAPERLRLTRAEVALLLAIVVLARLVATQWVHVYDDAFITYRYARHWAEGVGMTFNPGAAWEPILGTTTPGYTALIAGLVKLGFEAVRGSLLLNLGMDVISALILVRLGGHQRRLAGVMVLGFALMPELVRISVGGMEAPTLLALALGACLFIKNRRYVLAGMAAALCCTIRPEAVLFVLAIGFTLVRDRRALLRFSVPVIVIGVVYAGVLTAYFGDPIPQSVRSKAERHGGSPLLATWGEILKQGLLPRYEYLVFLPFLCLGWLRTFRSALQPLMVFGALILLAYLVARPHTWGWYYAVPLMAWVAAVAHGVDRVLEKRVSDANLERTSRIVLPLVALTIIAFGLLGRSRDLVTERVYQPLEAWAKVEGLVGGDHTILASDIGAVSYYARGSILDTEGLTWPEADPHGEQVGKILEQRPDYILLTAVVQKVQPFQASEAVLELYEPILRLSVAGKTDLEPSLEDLSDRWMQDYLLYRRRDL